MKWQPKAFDPTRPIKPNKSSRRITTELDDKDTLILIGSLNFGNVSLGGNKSIWVSFANISPSLINILNFSSPAEITYYGHIPSFLNIDDDFKIKLTITPTDVGNRSGKLIFKLRKKTVYFAYTAFVTPGGLFYNDVVAYDNLQTHSGSKV